MHALVVVAHPDPQSLTHAVAGRLAGGVVGSGHTAEIADLMAEGFDPRFNATDHAVHLKQASPSADVLAEQARIDRADALVLVYPVYWWSMPGLLKGWIDRVFSNGWAYDEIPGGRLEKKLDRLPVHLVGLGGASQRTYERHGYFDAMRAQIDHGIFDFCGARVVSSEFLLPPETQDLGVHLTTAHALGGGLFQASGRREAADAA